MTKFSRQHDVILINATLRVVVYDNDSLLLGEESNKRAEDELHFEHTKTLPFTTSFFLANLNIQICLYSSLIFFSGFLTKE